MKFVLYNLATAKEPWAEEAARLYTQKISHFTAFEIQNLKSKKSAREDSAVKKKEESDLILSSLTTDDYVVLFDERGKSFNSIEFSKKMDGILSSSKKRAIFIIGGAYGVSDEVRARAQLVVSLSPMVMNHILAQTVALEQIYRAFTILKNLPYHNS
ncbi:MAG: 23S rRNA (pseudouridine(1915)-N(3))-methyltransferase RlmH [Bdellovibrionaceae bacterium]|nr:23S rRNA (pseudouridine(1915)-N(3))-methyltransferase RlmH [Pseudobdellovibrionaceae bacterium]